MVFWVVQFSYGPLSEQILILPNSAYQLFLKCTYLLCGVRFELAVGPHVKVSLHTPFGEKGCVTNASPFGWKWNPELWTTQRTLQPGRVCLKN